MEGEATIASATANVGFRKSFRSGGELTVCEFDMATSPVRSGGLTRRYDDPIHQRGLVLYKIERNGGGGIKIVGAKAGKALVPGGTARNLADKISGLQVQGCRIRGLGIFSIISGYNENRLFTISRMAVRRSSGGRQDPDPPEYPE